MAIAKKRSSVSVAQFLGLVAVTIALSLVVDFGRKIAPYRRLQLEEAQLNQEIAYEENRQKYLKGLIGYVQSAEFVGKWAQTESKLVKSGETAVIPMFSEASIASPAQPREGTFSSEESHWREWWRIFFGDD